MKHFVTIHQEFIKYALVPEATGMKVIIREDDDPSSDEYPAKYAITKEASFEEWSYLAQKEYLQKHPESKKKLTKSPTSEETNLEKAKDVSHNLRGELVNVFKDMNTPARAIFAKTIKDLEDNMNVHMDILHRKLRQDMLSNKAKLSKDTDKLRLEAMKTKNPELNTQVRKNRLQERVIDNIAKSIPRQKVKLYDDALDVIAKVQDDKGQTDNTFDVMKKHEGKLKSIISDWSKTVSPEIANEKELQNILDIAKF